MIDKKTKRNLILILALIVSLVAGTLISSYGATQEELDAAKAAAKEASKRTEEKKKEVKAAAKKAAEAIENFEEARETLIYLQGQIEKTIAEIEETKEKKEKKEAEIKKQNDALNNRLEAMYKTGSVGIVDVVLNSESVADLLTNLGMVQKILESDQELLKKLQKDYEELKKLEKKLEEKQLELEEAEAYTEELQIRYKAEAEKYKAMQEELEAEAANLAAESVALQAEAEAMIVENGGEVETPVGAYAWPVGSGWKITSPFGWRRDPFGGSSSEYHSGLDIVHTNRTTYGAPIYAIADGLVTRASYYGAFGNCVQLACGGGISATYGHLSGYACKADQYVTKGTVLGYIGSTGRSTGPHLHFMIVKNGTRIDPFLLY